MLDESEQETGEEKEREEKEHARTCGGVTKCSQKSSPLYVKTYEYVAHRRLEKKQCKSVAES